MGLEVELIKSHERHYDPFLCAICQNLVDLDAFVTTKCSHVYCGKCLSLWLQKSTSCPTCNQDLMYANSTNSIHHSATMQIHDTQFLVQPLETSQPLAHRLLKSVLVECPLKKRGVRCDWQGDYADLQAHLLSSSAHATIGVTRTTETSITMEVEEATSDQRHRKALTLSMSLKEQANSQFESQHYKEAYSLYSKAISVLHESIVSNPPDKNDNERSEQRSLLATLYSNRAATNLQLGQYVGCIADCETVYQRLDSTNNKAYLRAARAEVQLGNLRQAETIITKGLQVSPTDATLKKENHTIRQLKHEEDVGRAALDAQRYGEAKATFGTILKVAPSGLPFLLGAAQADLGLGLTDSSLRLTKTILMKYPQSPKGCWVRGRTLFLMGETETGLKLMLEALRLDPDASQIKASYKASKKVKAWMEEAKTKVFRRAFGEAAELLSNCIHECHPLPPKSPLYATLHTDRAEVYLRLKDYHNALKDCALVLYTQDDSICTWLIKFKALHGLGDHETAMEEITQLLQKFEQNEQLLNAYQHADFLSRKKRRVDYYKLLEVSPIASNMEIKKAYKKRSLNFHPDRLPPDATTEQRQEAQRSFQLLGEGLEILSDDFQRKLYDDGYDAAAIRERVEAANQAAHRHREYDQYHHR